MFFFFFNDTAPTEIYTLPLHDALPISQRSLENLPMPAVLRIDIVDQRSGSSQSLLTRSWHATYDAKSFSTRNRSEEHTSELQSPCNLVCRLLLEKKKKIKHQPRDTLVL